jgi:hypothetical protein
MSHGGDKVELVASPRSQNQTNIPRIEKNNNNNKKKKKKKKSFNNLCQVRPSIPPHIFINKHRRQKHPQDGGSRPLVLTVCGLLVDRVAVGLLNVGIE